MVKLCNRFYFGMFQDRTEMYGTEARMYRRCKLGAPLMLGSQTVTIVQSLANSNSAMHNHSDEGNLPNFQNQEKSSHKNSVKKV